MMNDLLGRFWMTRFLRAPDGAGGGAGGDGDQGSEGEGDGDTGVVLNGSVPEGKAPEGTGEGEGEAEETPEGTEDGDPLDTVPEDGKYDLYVDEENGFELTDEAKEIYSKAFHGAGLTQRQVDEVVNAHQQMLFDMAQGAEKAAEAQLKAWVDEAKADPEMGKDWAATVSHANEAINKIADQGVIDELARTGLGNHPAFIRMFSKVGKMLGDDSFQSGAQAAAVVPAEKSWYGKTTPETKRA